MYERGKLADHGDKETLIKINNSLNRLPNTEPYRIVRELLLKRKVVLENSSRKRKLILINKLDNIVHIEENTSL